MMKKVINFILPFGAAIILTACGSPAGSDRVMETPVSETVHAEKPKGNESSGGSEFFEVEETGNAADNLTDEEKEEAENFDLESEQEKEMDGKILVVYFSCTGTTKALAEYASDILGTDLYEITPEEPYTDEDLAYYTGGRADREQDDPDARPGISGRVPDMAVYETIVLGFPLWHGQAPRIISTFLESYDFAGKTIIPFCTSHSSGIGTSADDLHTLCSDETEWKEGMRFGSGTSKEAVERWLSDVGVMPYDIPEAEALEQVDSLLLK